MRLHTKDGIVFQTAENSFQIQEAKKLRHDVYLEMGYITQPFFDGIIPDERDEHSTYIVALMGGQELVGTVRSYPGPSFETLEVWKENFFPNPEISELIEEVCKRKSVEIGALAVKKTARGRRISWGLYKALYLLFLMEKVNYCIAAIDLRAFKLLQWLGWSIIEIGPAKYFMGSLTVPIVMPMKEHLLSIYQKNPTYYEYLVG